LGNTQLSLPSLKNPVLYLDSIFGRMETRRKGMRHNSRKYKTLAKIPSLLAINFDADCGCYFCFPNKRNFEKFPNLPYTRNGCPNRL